jgi:hypothetical protein
MKKELAGLLAVGLMCLAPGIASAGYLTFDFTNSGSSSKSSCGVGCFEMESEGMAYEVGSDEVPGTNSWTFYGLMKFYTDPVTSFLEGNGSGPGAGWSFADRSGNGNDLFGTFTSTRTDSNPSFGQVNYTIDGGGNLFAGATGDGTSLISITNWFADYFTFFEYGRMFVRTGGSHTVPEPGMTGLFATGLVLLGFVMYRRRRARLPLE